MEENCRSDFFWPCLFMSVSNSVNSDYWAQADFLISKLKIVQSILIGIKPLVNLLSQISQSKFQIRQYLEFSEPGIF